jgi:hypothetical protein
VAALRIKETYYSPFCGGRTLERLTNPCPLVEGDKESKIEEITRMTAT